MENDEDIGDPIDEAVKAKGKEKLKRRGSHQGREA
jgi:hypothetical protein